ncbi:MAG: hypothetical protein HY707_12125 [Ignavibacteriae bacterium]|nr:hypothetical protein [Ignavibacteriota bacterium]
MNILNQVSPKRFRTIDDLLAFISIYDDYKRTQAYQRLLRAYKNKIKGSVCVEGGCGLGIFSTEMVKLGARKVYAIEQNPLLANLARNKIDNLPKYLAQRIEVVEEPLQSFQPRRHIDVLVQELYGQLLYDEDLWVLEHLKFKPDVVLPNRGELLAGVVSSASYRDAVVTPGVIEQLQGVLVDGLLEEKLTELRFPVLEWKYGKGLTHVRRSIKGLKGDLLCFGVSLTHNEKRICEAGKCPNWSYVWTARAGDKFEFTFQKSSASLGCFFRWIR